MFANSVTVCAVVLAACLIGTNAQYYGYGYPSYSNYYYPSMGYGGMGYGGMGYGGYGMSAYYPSYGYGMMMGKRSVRISDARAAAAAAKTHV